MSRYQKQNKANTVIIVTFIVALGMGLVLSFMTKSINLTDLTDLQYDNMDAKYQMNAALDQAEARLQEAVNGISLNNLFLQVPSANLNQLNFNDISNRYKDPNDDWETDQELALQFLRDAILAQSYLANGEQNPDHEFAYFDNTNFDDGATTCPSPEDCAFPSTWTDPDPTDNQFYEVRYSFYPLPTKMDMGQLEITFEYEYLIEVRAFGSEQFSESKSELSGVISIPLRNAPFSQWATIVNQLVNQDGNTLVFAGGNSANEIRQVFNGKVHVNGQGNFYGHPIFNDEFSSGEPFSDWRFWNRSNYTGCHEAYGGSNPKCFRHVSGYTENAPLIDYPNQLFNTLRLAAGDTSATAGTDTSEVAENELLNLLQENHEGSLDTVTLSAVPDGIYIPVDNQASKNIEGGIFVRGDAQVEMNVVEGQTDIGATYFGSIDAAHQNCKFQKLSINNLTSAETQDVFVGSGELCEVTYVFDAASPGNPPAQLNGRINGNVYVEGNIDELGGESRTRPAVARDFGFHITALKDVRIKNDLQYEDAEYHNVDSDGQIAGDPVASPYGEIDSSGVEPTNQNIGASIDEDSKTILGVSSLKRNIKVHINAPSNINLHMALFAGNSNQYDSSTEFGCGNSANTAGCGWGVEGYDTVTGRGSLKILGSIAHYRSQTVGRLSNPPTGYESKFFYDSRLERNLQPPGFPISNELEAFPVVTRFRAWRLSKASN